MLCLTTTAATSISGASTELLQLQGPRNTSVERGATARLRCHLLVAATTTTTPSQSTHSASTLRFIPWRASANQRISVQWNIDGFGFTNESLVESYGERYFMPGPLNEGVFDLFVYKVRNSDQTSFSCQVTIQTFRLLQPARVKTLTSSTVFLTIYSPPERLLLRRIPLPAASKHLQDGNINLQSDNPSLADVHTFQSFEKPLSPPRPATHRLQHSAALVNSMEATIQQRDEIWALEGQQIALECIASPSFPASKLMWILSPVAEVEEDLSLQPTFDFEDFSKRSRSLQRERKYPKWRFVFDAREGVGLGFRVENKEAEDSTSGLRVGSSTLTLRMDRSLSSRRVECLVQNAVNFEQSIMPKISTTLQVLYIKNMSITGNASKEEVFGGYFRENETVRFHCSADANPKELKYLWTLKEPSAIFSGKVTPDRGGASEKDGDEVETELRNGLSLLRLGPREREISTASFLDLQVTAQLHRQLLRCWASPVTGAVGISTDAPTWKHTSLLLSVSYGPKLQGPEEEVEAVTTGQSAQLTCQVEANPPAKVTWYHYRGIRVVNKAALDSHPNASGLFTATVITRRLLRSFLTTDLDSRDFRKLISEERYSALNVKANSIDSYGFYICVGLAAQREVRKIVVLAESGPPQIDTPTRVSGRVGGRSRIACHTIALPKPTPHEFIWSHASTHASVVPSSSLHIEHEEKLTGSTSTLVFSKIAKEHFGHYNCTVTTAFGSDSIVIVFTEIHDVSYTFIIGVGVGTVVVLLFGAAILWTLRHRLLHPRGGKTARIITANQAARQSVDLHCVQALTLGRQSLGEECSEIRRDSTCASQTSPMETYSSLLRSPCHVIACEDGAVYKCITTASTPTTPLLTRLREPPSSPPTLYVATATDATSTGEVTGISRVALLTNCSTNFQDQFFPT
ncbi:hypothetical protein TcWFU_004740 [Taenia crassiceps]|uniref:Ig-like domain-containing protein n=1 Tax=Taenia crassiceps TaxID=6207 RepID=A0ABR4Q7W6_9CEST